MRLPRYILPAAMLTVPLAALASGGCGFFTFPGDGVKALGENAQRIRFSVPIVDQDGAPLEGVTVTTARHSREAELTWAGMWSDTYSATVKDKPFTVDRQLDYDGFGKAAVTVTFEKSGYESVTQTYANADYFERRQGGTTFGAFAPQPDLSIFNLTKGPPPAVVLKRKP